MLDSLAAEVFGITRDPKDAKPLEMERSAGRSETRPMTLVIFPDSGNALGARQENLLASDREMLIQRDIVILKVDTDDVRQVFGAMHHVEGQSLRDQAGAVEGVFTLMVLDENDATIMRSDTPLSLDEILIASEGTTAAPRA